MADTFHCVVVTPSAQLAEVEASHVMLPLHDGKLGVLPQRAALLMKLGVGVLSITEPSGSEQHIHIDGGFVEKHGPKLTVLSENARLLSEIDRTEAEQLLQETQNRRALTDEEVAEREHDAELARTMLRAMN